MQMRNFVLVFVSLLLSVSVAVAQDVCPTIVADALTATDEACVGIGRNEACYGNVQITAELADEDLVFEQQGDLIDLTAVERLTLAPYDEETGAWGVALMQVQANIPDTMPGQGVTFLLFGDVEIDNAVTEDDDGFTPMQAFYFKSGIGTAGCDESENGIIINTPEGVGTVSLTANDVTIELGSTAVLTAQPDDLFTIALIEGHSTVTALGESQEFEGGFFVTVPINEDLEAIGVPSEPQPILEGMLENYPDVTVFIPEVEGSIGSSGDSGSDEVIVPLPGTWEFAVGEITTSAGCPPGLGDMMSSQAFPLTTVEIDGPFNLQAMMEEAGDLPPDTTFDNPSPNVYSMAFTQEGGSFEWITTLESEELMTSEYTIDMNASGFSCAMTINYSMTFQG